MLLLSFQILHNSRHLSHHLLAVVNLYYLLAQKIKKSDLNQINLIKRIFLSRDFSNPEKTALR